MKNTFTLLLFLNLSIGLFGQFEIVKQGDTINISGTTIPVVGSAGGGSSELSQSFTATNVSGGDVSIKVRRKKIIALDGTANYICIGDPALGGACYPAYEEDPWETPCGGNLQDGGSILFSVYHTTNDVIGSAKYRYYLVDCSNESPIDSVDVEFTYSLSTAPAEKFSIKAYPNPAQNNLNVKMINGSEDNMAFEIYDVSGQLVKKERLDNGINTVDVSELVDGVYFYSIKNGEGVIRTKKLVIKK